MGSTRRAAIYVRISRDRVGAGLGVERQETDCRELAQKLGLEVALVYVDNDVSAYSGRRRPGYRQLLTDLTAGRIDVILGWHTDRLHRSPVELEEYISACEARGVPTHTVKAGPLDLATPSGRLVARQLGAVARYEVEHQVERQQRAKLQAATAGQWGGGRRPFGYDADGKTIRPGEQADVVAATDAVLLGQSLRAQCARLNGRGAVTSTGRPWQPTELRRVLMRARNAGLREHRGAVIGKAQWPPLVEEEKWRAACAILGDPGRRTATSSARRWLLANIAVCGVCGDRLRVTLLNSTRASVPSYACKNRKCVVRHAAELESFISGVVVERLSRKDAIDLLRPASTPVDTAALHAEATTLQDRIDALADDIDLDERTLARRTKALRSRLEEIERQKADAGRRSVFTGLVDAPDVAAAWAGFDLDRRRAVISELMTVTVHRTTRGRPAGWTPGTSYFDPRGIEIVWKD